MEIVLGFNEVVLSELFYNELPFKEVSINNNIYNYRILLVKQLHFTMQKNNYVDILTLEEVETSLLAWIFHLLATTTHLVSMIILLQQPNFFL